MEKRRLMKLLQQCYTSGLGSLASTINEKELTASRSLLRPQNAQNAQKAQKGISVENETEIDAEAEAEAEIEANVDFPTYLATRHSISPSSLSSTIILYALCLNQLGPLSPSPSLPSSFAALFSQLSSLGRYAEQGVRTGVLVPMYGGGEIGQGFCRMGAVNGVTYLLRRGGERIVFKTSRARVRRVENDVKGVVVGGDVDEEGGEGEARRRLIRCKNVIVGREHLDEKRGQKDSQMRILRR